MSAGGKWRNFKAKGKSIQLLEVLLVRYVHPHGGIRHQHVGVQSIRDAPLEQGSSIAARKTGRG